MKRWMSLVLLLLLLSGCGIADTSDNQTTAPTTPKESELPLAAYDLPMEGCTAIIPMGDEPLLLWQDGMARLSGKTGRVLAQADIGVDEQDVLYAGSDGVIYYEENCLRYLDDSLQQLRYIRLEDGVLGSVHLTEDQSTLYYCTHEGIREMDLTSGVVRTICHRVGDWLGVTQSFCNSTVLQCPIEENGQVRTLYFSTASGEMLRETEDLVFLDAEADLYFCSLQQGDVSQYFYGWGSDQPRFFHGGQDGEIYPLLNCALAVTAESANSGVSLNCFNLRTGKRIAAIGETGVAQIDAIAYLNEKIYFTGGQRLYCWNPAKTPVEDHTNYMSFRYTREDPDELGMQRHVDTAKMLEELYGINIVLWEDVYDAAPNGYEFVGEYIPEQYDAAMTALKTALGQFPEQIFRKVADWTDSKELNIVLVREIITDEKDSHPNADGIQYLLNGDAYIALELQEDVERSFYHWMGHILDIHVLSNSKKLYEWEKVNPNGFSYENEYTYAADKNSSKFLSGSRKYFIDAFSTSFPVEDRATIFEYAITSGNEEMFESKYMQVKLRRICDGIRDAFGLKLEDYPWEQYLN